MSKTVNMNYRRVNSGDKTWLQNYLETVSSDHQRQRSQRFLQKYPRRVPVLIDRTENCQLEISTHRHLVDRADTLGQFVGTIRSRIKLGPENALVWFVNGNTVACLSHTMGQLYDEHKNGESLVLLLQYSEESVFGRPSSTPCAVSKRDPRENQNEFVVTP